MDVRKAATSRVILFLQRERIVESSTYRHIRQANINHLEEGKKTQNSDELKCLPIQKYMEKKRKALVRKNIAGISKFSKISSQILNLGVKFKRARENTEVLLDCTGMCGFLTKQINHMCMARNGMISKLHSSVKNIKTRKNPQHQGALRLGCDCDRVLCSVCMVHGEKKNF